MKALKIAVDASRVRSGGGVAHLIGILNQESIDCYGIKEIHVWAYRALLDQLPDRTWLIKHHPPTSEQSILKQLFWQATKFSDEIRDAGCHILFSADASTLCTFKPSVVLNQNMLPYDDGMLPLFGWSRERLRQWLIYIVQKRAFRRSEGVIFLTQHAAHQIQKHTGLLKFFTCIPHGMDSIFSKIRHEPKLNDWTSTTLNCIYVSPVHEYKYQWVVVKAFKILRDRGYDAKITLVGGGAKRPLEILQKQISTSDPNLEFVEVIDFLPHNQIPYLIAKADIFVFASGCETFGIALLEAMASGIPIACSNKSSMPETLKDAGEYFDPADEISIANAIENLILNPGKREFISLRAKQLSESYSWQRCADETWRYLVQTYDHQSALNCV